VPLDKGAITRGEELGFTSREPSETKKLKAEGKGRVVRRAHNCLYEPCIFYARKRMLHRFRFVNLSKGPPATNRKSLGGQRGGEVLAYA